MSRCNVFDLDRRSLALSVEGSAQSYRKSLFTTLLCCFFFFITSIILYSYGSSIWRLMHGYYNRIDWKQLRGYMHACALYIVLFSCSSSSSFTYLSHFPNRKHTHTSKQAFTNIFVSSQIKAKFTFSGLHNCKYIKCTWKPALTHMFFFFSHVTIQLSFKAYFTTPYLFQSVWYPPWFECRDRSLNENLPQKYVFEMLIIFWNRNVFTGSVVSCGFGCFLLSMFSLPKYHYMTAEDIITSKYYFS